MAYALDVPGVIRAIGVEPYGPGLSLVLEDWGDRPLHRLLVAGPSGVGKSALVYALREQVRERRGIFAPGKFDL